MDSENVSVPRFKRLQSPAKVTPAEARAVWEAMKARGETPTVRGVADALAAKGRKVCFQTIARWQTAGWPDRTEWLRTHRSTGERLEKAVIKTFGRMPQIVAFDAKLSIVEALEQTCREGLDVARAIFGYVKANPELIAKMPANLGIMLGHTGRFMAELLNALGGAESALARGMKDITPPPEQPRVRPRESDPLKPGLDALEAELRRLEAECSEAGDT